MKPLLTALSSTLLSSSLPFSTYQRKRILRCTFLLLLVGLAVIGSSFQKENLLNSSQKESSLKKAVPFKGKTTLTLEGNGLIVGTGQGTHIGRFNFHVQDDESNFPFITGTETITAANEDKIIAKHSGYVMDLGNGILKLTFEAIITGGTGRFAEATGSYTEHATAN